MPFGTFLPSVIKIALLVSSFMSIGLRLCSNLPEVLDDIFSDMIKVIIFLFAGVAVAAALVCEPDFCDRIRCKVTTCAPGEVRTKKNNCQCCGICVPLQSK
ncbi:hypothetical protein AVEN_74353-1 [Araneus ventricosus]|uniref:Uncharacterized protein n=1 Tax=Araneus ventricosus TaxID=182803 RepID=A0A4Y2VDE6_ARAVE|nr:hypothetical protein AVEN_74353-1 [Araneus ventricosus]